MAELEPQNNERIDQAGAVAITYRFICAIRALFARGFWRIRAGHVAEPTAEWAFTLVAVSIRSRVLSC